MVSGTLRRVVGSLVAMMFLNAALAGQSGSSTIAGIVRDATAPVPGVLIHVTNEYTGISVGTVTSDEGAYGVPGARLTF